AILIETCFVDSRADADLYNQHFQGICEAIAETIAGKKLEATPPEEIAPPEPTEPTKPRPLIGRGDYVNNVYEVRMALGAAADRDFGPATEDAVMAYQSRKGLSVDGMVGNNTWNALRAEFNLSAYPPPLPAMFTQAQIDAITDMAINEPIASYSWRDRGQAPAGDVKCSQEYGWTHR